MMDNLRLPLYLGLILVSVLLWQRWEEANAPPAPPQVATPAATSADNTNAGEPDMPGVPPTPTPADHSDMPDAGVTPKTGTPPVTEAEPEASPAAVRGARVRTDLFDLDIGARGGDITRLDMLAVKRRYDDPTPLRLFENEVSTYIAQSGLLHDRVSGGADYRKLAPTHRAGFTLSDTDYTLRSGEDYLRVPMLWRGPDGIVVEKTYIFRRGSYVIQVEHRVINRGENAWVGRQYRQLRRGVPREDGSPLIYTFTGAAYYDGAFKKLEFDEIAQPPLAQNHSNAWVAMLQHYFVSAFIPTNDNAEYIYSRAVNTPSGMEYIIGMRSAPQTAAPGGETQFTTHLFAGPKIQDALEQAAPGLELTVDYGMLTLIAQPMFYGLSFIYDWAGNWGVAIVLLTLLIKLLFYKLSAMSYRSMARMRKFQPRFSSLRERYKDDKARLNKELTELYRKEKINPLGGCLPILIQVPFFIALYWVLLESAELRQAPLGLWIQDLSVRDPYFVLPVLMGATMIFQMRLNPTPPDPMQAKVMMFMPYIFTVFFAFFPAGLVLYWLVNNMLSIAQQWHITKRLEKADD